ncbi:MAG: hypothetical protein AB1439_09600 [candidate division FCPU426 bacterium]
MTRKPNNLIVFLLVLYLAGFAGWAQAGAGKSGWPIFQKVRGARFSSLAGIGQAADVLGNPALLGAVSQTSLAMISELGFAEDKFGGLLLAVPWPEDALAGGFVYYDAGPIELNWIEDGTLQTETVLADREVIALGSYGRRLAGNLWTGATLKFVQSELAERESAWAVAADAGAMWKPEAAWLVLAAVQNLGWSAKYLEAEIPLPGSVYLGSSYVFRLQDWQVLPGVGLAYNWVDETWFPEAGLEVRYKIASVNAGYRLNQEEAYLHFGAGLCWQNIEINYAYIPGMFLNASHRMSIAYRFGEPPAAPVLSLAPAVQPAALPVRTQTAKAEKTAPKPAPVRETPLPRIVSLKSKGARITVAWKPPQAEGPFTYNVYMSTSKTQPQKINVQPITKLSFSTKILRRKQTYYLSVTAVAGNGVESVKTKAQRIYLK